MQFGHLERLLQLIRHLRPYKDIFYSRSRRALNEFLDTTLDSLKPHRISTLQTLVLLSTYEFLHANFGHAWMNCGRAARMSVYFNLLRLDEPHLFCKQTLLESKDWIDQEERRRTFWAAFMLDRFASLGTGWAATFNEDDITTCLPGPDDEYQAGVRLSYDPNLYVRLVFWVRILENLYILPQRAQQATKRLVLLVLFFVSLPSWGD